MPTYTTKLNSPWQAFQEFGRAAAAGLGVPISPVTVTENISGKRLRSGRVINFTPAKRPRIETTRAPVLMRTGPTMGPAMTTRTRRTRFKHQLGMPMSYANKSQYSYKKAKTVASAEKQRHFTRLVRIPYSDQDDLFNRRKGRLVNVKGVRFQWTCRLKPSANINEPLTIRWCVVNPRDNDGEETLPTNNWFRSLNPGTEYAEDFPIGTGGGAGWGDHYDLMTRGINRRKYGVLKEGHFVLSPAETGNNDTRKTWRQQKLLQFYIPIYQQMKWTGNGVEYPSSNLYFVWWYCGRGDLGDLATYADVNTVPIEEQQQITCFFRNASGLT